MVVIEAGRIGIGERFGDPQTDIAPAPIIGEADIEQVGAQAQLDHDPRLAEQVEPLVDDAALYAQKEALGIVVANFAVASPIFGSSENRSEERRVGKE